MFLQKSKHFYRVRIAAIAYVNCDCKFVMIEKTKKHTRKSIVKNIGCSKY